MKRTLAALLQALYERRIVISSAVILAGALFWAQTGLLDSRLAPLARGAACGHSCGCAPGSPGNGIPCLGCPPGTGCYYCCEGCSPPPGAPPGANGCWSPPSDSTPPTTTASLSGTPGSGGWYISPVTVSLSATDADSGVASTTLDSTSYSSPRMYSAEGTNTISFYSTDAAGNTESAQSGSFQIDTVSPSVTGSISGTLGGVGWYVSPVTLTLAASDSTSGIADIALDGSPSTGPVTYAADGNHLHSFSATDMAGNSSGTSTVTFKVDLTPPSTGLNVTGAAGKNGWYVSPLALSLTATDASSGVAATYLNGSPYAGGWAVGSEQDYTYTYYSTDAAGNTEGAHSTTLQLDLRPPVISLHAPFGLITLSATDGRSGVDGGVVGIMSPGWQLLRHWNFSGDSATVFWDGTDERGQPVPPGSFVWAAMRDDAGNEATTSIDAPPTPTPTATPTATPTITPTHARPTPTPLAAVVIADNATSTSTPSATPTATPRVVVLPPPREVTVAVARAVEQNLNWFLIAVGFALFGLAAVPAAGYYSDPRTAAIGRLQSLGARWLKTDRDYTQSQSDGD